MYSLCKFIYENIRVKSKYCKYEEIIYKKIYILEQTIVYQPSV